MAQQHQLSRRERQIMDVVYKLGRATAGEVHEGLPEQPTYSTVRAQMRVLEEKGFLRHEQQGPRYLYIPTTPAAQAKKSALRHLVDTFFAGSPEQLVCALIEDETVSDEDLSRMRKLIERARKEGR